MSVIKVLLMLKMKMKLFFITLTVQFTMGIDVESWRACIGTFNGGKGSRKLRALLAFRRLYLRDSVAWATGETTNCTPVAVQASIACLSLWLILRFLGSCWNKIKSTHPTKFNGGLSYHWSKDPKAPVSITLSIAVVVAIAVLLHSLTILLLRAGDVELNPGPTLDTVLTIADIQGVRKALFPARTSWFDIGLVLEVDHETLCGIRELSNDGLCEMLSCCLTSGSNITWRVLCASLRDPTVGRNDVANDIQRKLEEQTAGNKGHGGTATNIPPIQDPSDVSNYPPASEDFPLDFSIRSTFPYLDCGSLSEREKKSLCFRLLGKSKKLHRKFSKLCTSTYLSLKDKDISKDELVVCITGDDSLESFVQGQNKSILADRKQELYEARNIAKVWEIASDYFSYFNYYLIEQIIEHFGTQEDKQKLAEYMTSFTEYVKLSFRKCPAGYGIQNETDSVIIVKLESPQYDDCTLSQLELFINELSEVLKLTQDGVLRLCRVLPGCVELTLLAPSFVETAVFPLSPYQEAALKALGVVRLRCGDNTYPSQISPTLGIGMARQQPQDRPRNKTAFRKIELFKDETLGVGSYGCVCKARCDHLLCAAKIIHPILVPPNALQQISPQREHRLPIERFEMEFHFLKEIRHPNIIQYLGMYQDPETGFSVLLMELMDESLTHFLESSVEPIPYHIQLAICLDIVQALSFLHLNGIIHMHLSSNNILLIGKGRAKLTDFGMAKLVDVRLSNTMCPGTDAYMPPEAIDNQAVYTEKGDVFSFGVNIIQILTRKFPKPGDRFNTVPINDPRFPSGRVEVRVSEIERRKNHISEINPAHPLLPIALDCLKDQEGERPSAGELCQRLAALKDTPEYTESEREVEDRRTTQLTTLAERDREIKELRQQLLSQQRELDKQI